MRDGDIDYSRYALPELEEALAGIDRDQYPINYRNLRAAYERLTVTLQEAAPPAGTASVGDPAQQESPQEPWNSWWRSRPVAALLGAICLGWAYELATSTEACPAGKKLVGSIVESACESFGPLVAAGIPLAIGLLSLACAVLPRRQQSKAAR